MIFFTSSTYSLHWRLYFSLTM